MKPHKDLEKAVKLMTEHIESLQREFGHIVTKKNLISNSVIYENNPEATKQVRKGINSLLEGSLLIYLFAMWESHTPENISEWLTIEEDESLNAFKHVRDSAAHKYKGERADFKKRRDAFEEKMPFSAINWEKTADTIDLSSSSVALDCHRLMVEVTKKLVTRLYHNAKP